MSEIEDDTMRTIVEWTLATRSPGAPALRSRPFSERLAPEIIGTVVVNNYINRMMDTLLDQTFIPTNRPIRAALVKASSLFLTASVRRSKRSGESLRFIAEAVLPDNLRWAAPHAAVSRAFASLADAVNAGGEAVLDEQTRGMIRHVLDEWDGTDPGISRKWTERPLEPIPERSRTAAKLALLTAIAPYQVDEELVREFRSACPDDRQLLYLLSWASFTAACKVGEWCAYPK